VRIKLLVSKQWRETWRTMYETSNLPVLFDNNCTLILEAKYVWNKLWNTIRLFKFPQHLGSHAAAQNVIPLSRPCHYLSIKLVLRNYVFKYLETLGSYDCHFTPMYWFWYSYNFIFCYLTYLNFVFYTPEDCHMVSRNMQFTLYIN